MKPETPLPNGDSIYRQVKKKYFKKIVDDELPPGVFEFSGHDDKRGISVVWSGRCKTPLDAFKCPPASKIPENYPAIAEVEVDATRSTKICNVYYSPTPECDGHSDIRLIQSTLTEDPVTLEVVVCERLAATASVIPRD